MLYVEVEKLLIPGHQVLHQNTDPDKNVFLTSWLRSISERKENVLLFFHFLSGFKIKTRQ